MRSVSESEILTFVGGEVWMDSNGIVWVRSVPDVFVPKTGIQELLDIMARLGNGNKALAIADPYASIPWQIPKDTL